MVIIIMAWRNIWRNKIRSLIIIGSVVMGLLSGLFVLSLYKGILEDRVHAVIYTEVAHLQIHNPKFKDDFDAKFVITDGNKVIRTLNNRREVEAYATRTISHGMLATGTGSSGIEVIGVDPKKEHVVSQIGSKIKEGEGFKPEKKNQAIVGKKLADKMDLKLNSKIILTFTDKEGSIVSGAFRVAAIYQTDNAPLDERKLFVNQKDLNNYLAIGEQFHELALILKDEDDMVNVQKQLQNDFPELKIESWAEISPETKLMIDTTDQYSYIFIAIIMLALSFGIINTMLMAVLERSREIGMLLALGMNRIKVFSMVLTETVFLTVTGVPVGIFATWVVVVSYHAQGLDISTLGGKAMSEFGFSSMIYPAFPWEKLAIELTIVIAAAILSSLIPAIKAIKLRPVEALQK